MAEHTIQIDVIDMSIPKDNHRNLAVINEPNPCYNYTANADVVADLIQISRYWIFEAGTNKTINGVNYYDYFPEEGGGGGGGGSTLIPKDINENGFYQAIDDFADGYSSVYANVPNTYEDSDEGKVVDNGTLISQTSTSVNQNGTVNTTTNNEVVVNVPNTYEPSDEGKVVDNGTLVPQTAMPTEIVANNTYDTTLFNSVVVNVPQGGGGGSVQTGVRFIDYDGTVVKTYTPEEFAQLEAMPENPSHEGLTAQGWNWSLANAKEYVAEYESLNIGQMYITSDGKTRFYISLPEGRTSPILQLYLNANSELDIDWGDGGTHSTFTTTSAGYKSERHEYPDKGDYVITITVVIGGFELISSNSNVSSILWNANSSQTSPDSAYNSSIKRIEVGSSVKGIGSYAFNGCYSLSAITMPNTITSIGTYAFSNCRSLSSVTIPEGVTSIQGYAFKNCFSLTSVTIPEGVTSIGTYAFGSCYSLTSVTIPNTITGIGTYAFSDCTSLSSITIPEGVTSIGSSVFNNCYALSSVTIPEGVTSIGGSAFSNCASLTSVTIPEGVTSIGSGAFSGCYALSSITIPEGVTSIGNSAFNNCYALSSVTIPEGVTSIGSNVFNNCYALSAITMPNTITSIGTYAFGSCYSLTSVTIPEGVTSIGSSVFYNCNSLSAITMPNTITSIGSSVFYTCYSLSSVTIPEGVTSIGSSAFSNCYALSSVTIPEGVTSIGSSAFSSCTYVSFIKFEPSTPATVSSSNAWSYIPNSTLILAPIGSYNAYKTASNYPNPSTFTYLAYNTYESGEALPATTPDELYSLVWYASMADAKSQTNPITQGTGDEVYSRATAV